MARVGVEAGGGHAVAEDDDVVPAAEGVGEEGPGAEQEVAFRGGFGLVLGLSLVRGRGGLVAWLWRPMRACGVRG